MVHKRVRWALLAAVAALCVALPASAGAATQIGETFTPATGGCNGASILQSSSPGGQYTVPSAGVISSWAYRTDANTPTLRLKVGRLAGGNSFTIIGESEARVPLPNALNGFPTRVPVQAGDVIGLYHGGPLSNCARAAAGFVVGVFDGGDVPPASTVSFSQVPDFQLDVAATLEPDCDSDGFGDETQDPDVVSCDGVAPDTQITKSAPNKTAKRKAKFKFTSDEPDSSFECKLDGKPFKPCTSPRTVKHLDEGKHKFKVRAIDAAGNVDPSAAKDKFKVVG